MAAHFLLHESHQHVGTTLCQICEHLVHSPACITPAVTFHPAKRKSRNTTCCIQWAETLARQAISNIFPVTQFDCAVAGTHQRQPHFDFMVGTDMITRTVRASTVLTKGKKDSYVVFSILSCLSEVGHSKGIIQSDGEQASEIYMRKIQGKKTHHVIIFSQQRYSHQSNGGGERMAQPHAIKSRRARSKSRQTQESLSKSTVFCPRGYHDFQRCSARDSTRLKTLQP